MDGGYALSGSLPITWAVIGDCSVDEIDGGTGGRPKRGGWASRTGIPRRFLLNLVNKAGAVILVHEQSYIEQPVTCEYGKAICTELRVQFILFLCHGGEVNLTFLLTELCIR